MRNGAHKNEHVRLSGEYKLLISLVETAEKDILTFEKAVNKNWDQKAPSYKEFFKSMVFFEELERINPNSPRVTGVLEKARNILKETTQGEEVANSGISSPPDTLKQNIIASFMKYAISEEINVSDVSYLAGGIEKGTGDIDHILECETATGKATAFVFQGEDPVLLEEGEEAQDAVVGFYMTHCEWKDSPLETK